MSVLLIGGSPSLNSSGARLLHHIGERLASHGHHCSRLHVRDLPAAALLHADFTDAAIVRALAQVQAADAIVISTPVYKAAYSGILKAFLDLLPRGRRYVLEFRHASWLDDEHRDETLKFLEQLGATHVIVDSPRIEGANCYGPAKLAMIEAWLAEQGLIRDAVTVRFYSDHASDQPAFEWADEPVAVNPHARLARLAATRGWQVEDWG